ncbi:MAG: ATPase, T2SS/T4P/T4SS family [Vicinamibacterales bacterium]
MATPSSPTPAPDRLGARGRRRLLGEMLIAQGIISPEQLAEVLRIQKHEKNVRIGSLLVEMGHVTESQLADLIADQLRLPSVDMNSVELSAEAVGKLSKELATKHRCLPWLIEGRNLRLFMADPTDLVAIDAIQFHTGFRVQPVVGAESEVVAAITRAYSDEHEAVDQFCDNNLELTDHLAVVDANDGDETGGGNDEDLQKAALAAPVTKLVNAIFVDAIRMRASDIHIEPQQKGTILRYRIDGRLQQVMTMPKRTHPKVVSRIKVSAHMDIAERRRPQDGRTRLVLNGETYDFRVSSLPTADGEKIVIRILARNSAKVKLEELGFEPDTLHTFLQLLKRPQGLILVTGPTGSGKTSTLYAALNHVVSETTNIVTVEDPVEYRLGGINQVAVSEKAGLTFAAGLRSILRQDPDIVMVGEIRDGETAQVAFHAAQTGHLVLSTLHTNDAPSTVARLVDMGVPAYIVASSVIGVLAQRLVRRMCTCRVQHADGTASPKGCEQCRNLGFRGRMAIHELLQMTPRVRRAVMGDASMDAIRDAALQSGMRGMFEDGLRKVAHGLTIREEIERVVPPPEVEDQGSVQATGPVAERPGTHGQPVLAVVSNNSPVESGTAVAAGGTNPAIAAPPSEPRAAIAERSPEAPPVASVATTAAADPKPPVSVVTPSAQPAPQPAPPPPPAPVLPSLPRMRLVVLSARAAVVEGVRSALGPEEHDVVGAATGSDALASIREAAPDLVVAEHNVEAAATLLLKIMRSDSTLKSIPVLLVSAGGDANAEITALAAGADDFLPFPFSAGVFLRRLRRIMARSPRKAVA